MIKTGKFVSLLVLMFGATSCLTPKALIPVADQNSENIKNYTSNVSAISNALKKEAEFHGKLEIQIARNQVATLLINKIKSWLSPVNPNSQHLSDASKEPHKSMLDDLSKVKKYLELVKENNDESATKLLTANKYPLLSDVAIESPGFTITRILVDAFKIKEINSSIIKEADLEVKRALMNKRNKVLDEYLFVKTKKELILTYQEALDEYLKVVSEQGQVASYHAESISSFAHSKPRAETLFSALKDEDLRSGVLGLIKEKKGEKYSQKVGGYLKKADDFMAIIDGLKK